MVSNSKAGLDLLPPSSLFHLFLLLHFFLILVLFLHLILFVLPSDSSFSTQLLDGTSMQVNSQESCLTKLHRSRSTFCSPSYLNLTKSISICTMSCAGSPLANRIQDGCIGLALLRLASLKSEYLNFCNE